MRQGLFFVSLCVFLALIALSTSKDSSTNTTTPTIETKFEDEEVLTIDNVNDVINAFGKLKFKHDLFIRGLRLDNNNDAQKLSDLLGDSNKCPIKRFLLTRNKIVTDKFIEILFQQGVSKNKNIRVVGITRLDLKSESTLQTIGESLSKMPALKKVYFYKNNLNASQLSALLNSFVPKGLEKLTVIENQIGDAGVEAILAFQKKYQIPDLVLRDVAITNEGAKKLGAAIKESKILRKIDISENKLLTAEGLNAIAEGLKENVGITHLEMAYISITEQETVKKFASLFDDSLTPKSTLKRIDMSECKMGPKGAFEVAELIKKETCRGNMSWDLSSNSFKDEDVENILLAVKGNKNFKGQLFVYRNEITSEKLQTAAKEMKAVFKTDYMEDESLAELMKNDKEEAEIEKRLQAEAREASRNIELELNLDLEELAKMEDVQAPEEVKANENAPKTAQKTTTPAQKTDKPAQTLNMKEPTLPEPMDENFNMPNFETNPELLAESGAKRIELDAEENISDLNQQQTKMDKEMDSTRENELEEDKELEEELKNLQDDIPKAGGEPEIKKN